MPKGIVRIVASLTLLLILLTASYVLGEPDSVGTLNDSISSGIEDASHQVESFEQRKNCRELEGHLCYEGGCALTWLNSTDSFCCPIECDTCPIDVSCEDDDPCTKNSCLVVNEGVVCKTEITTPCLNNGVCEPGEIDTPFAKEEVSAFCLGETHSATSVHGDKGSDCPITCEDGDSNTADYYDFNLQECIHVDCSFYLQEMNTERGCGDGICDDSETYLDCPNDCTNPCPEECNDNHPFTIGFCDETTNYQCLFEGATCGNEDGICPPNGEFNEINAGCYNRDDPDCSLLFSFEMPDKFGDASFNLFRRFFSFTTKKIFYGLNAWNYSNSQLSELDLELGTEYPTSNFATETELYIGTSKNRILVLDTQTLSLLRSVNISEIVPATNPNNYVWLLYVSGEQIFAGLATQEVVVMNKNDFVLIENISTDDVVFFLDFDYLYISKSSKVTIFDPISLELLNEIDTNFDAKEFDSNAQYFVNLEREINDHYYLKIWDKITLELVRIVDVGIFRRGLLVDDQQIYLGGSHSHKKDRFVEILDFEGNSKRILWGNHGKFARPLHSAGDFLIVYSPTIQEDETGSNILQKWKT